MSGSTVALKRLSSVTYGLGQPPPLADDGVPILRATNIERGSITRHNLIFAALEDLPTDRVPLVRAGETLVVRSGAYTGDSAMVTPEWQGASPGYDLRVIPLPGLEPRFLAYSLLGRLALDHMVLASSRAAQPHLNAEELGEVSIWSVPLGRQQAIADFLDAETARIDALIAKKRPLILAVEERVRVLAEQVLWSVRADPVPLMHRTMQGRPIMYGIVLPGPDVPEGVPIVKGGDVAAGRLMPSELDKTTIEIEAPYARARLRKDDLLFAIRGGIGDVAIVPRQLEGANITQDVARVAPSPDVDPEWLKLVLQTLTVKRQVEARTTGATIRGLNIWELKRITVPFSSPSRQQGDMQLLGPAIRQRDDLRVALTRQIALLQERRQALITAAVTGELDIVGAA